MELRDYVRLLRRRWRTIVVVLAACLLGTTIVTVLQPPSYQASTNVLVALPGGAVSAGAPSVTSLTQVVSSFTSVISSPAAVEAAVSAAGLASTKGVSVTATAETGAAVMQISVVAGSPSTAQAVANAYVRVLPTVLANLQQITSPTALVFTALVPAALPTSTFRPDPLVNTAVGLALGLILSLTVAVARETLDRRIRDSRGIEERVGVSVLGVVPHELASTALPAVTYPDSARTESYRKVRTNLLFSGPEGMLQSLAVTSAVAGEGKTTLATNLAVVCAQAGQRVALVDADLRKPKVHEKLGLSNFAGLSTVLAGEAYLMDVSQVDINGLTVVTSGPPPRDPSAFLERGAFRELIKELEASFDLVIVDTTPVLAVSDAAQVAAICQGTVIVSRLRSTTFDSLLRGRQSLDRVKASVVGIVAVGHDEDPDAGYRYYYTALDGQTGRRGSHRRQAAEVPRAGWRRAGGAG